MGCAAAVNALKVAHHIVRSEPRARVLVVNIELCTLHMQDTAELDKVLSALLFGDGCTAALVSGEPTGIALMDFKVAAIPATQDLITWSIGDTGFDMHLAGEVPSQISRALERRQLAIAVASSEAHVRTRWMYGQFTPAVAQSSTPSTRAST
jgi:predicted naringenin-chalcone synthase